MTPPTKPTRCRAKKRSVCRWHGAEDRLLKALSGGRMSDYFDAASELEALGASNWQEGGGGFVRPVNRAVESLADIETLLDSKEVLADTYTAEFEYGWAYRPAVVRRSAKKAGIFFHERKSAAGVIFEFTAGSKSDLRFLKTLLEHNANMRADDEAQATYLKFQQITKGI